MTSSPSIVRRWLSMSWSGRRLSRKSITGGVLGGELVDEDAHLSEGLDDGVEGSSHRIGRTGGRGEEVIDDEPDDEQGKDLLQHVSFVPEKGWRRVEARRRGVGGA